MPEKTIWLEVLIMADSSYLIFEFALLKATVVDFLRPCEVEPDIRSCMVVD